jgi:hypothetical protein
MSVKQHRQKIIGSRGHISRSGAPAIQTTARYTQVSREQVRRKLDALRGVQ